MADAAVVLTTLGSAEAAARLGRELVELRLAACASVLPGMRSIYRWEGAIADEAEALLLLKTPPARVAALREALLARHPYDVPELLVLDARDVPEPYARWLDTETAETP